MSKHQRTGSRLSFRRSSSSSIPRIDATETSEEKHRFYVKGKADPSKAINEAEPAAVANSEVTLGKPLRQLEHRDQDGNLIADPDRSNPTRPRLERPLDTIRSFEAAIDGSYYKRQSYRTETPNPMNNMGRRTSLYNNQPSMQRRGYSESGGLYTDRSGYGNSDGYHENGNSASANYNGGSQRRFGPRNNSDPALYGNNQAGYQQQGGHYSHAHQPSHDTVGGNSNGSYMTEPWGNSTDPSSENSSIDRFQQPTKQDPGEAYGYNGYGGGAQFRGPIMEEYHHGDPAYGEQGYGQSQPTFGNGHSSRSNAGPPPVPQHGAPPPPPPPKDSAAQRAPSNPGYGGMDTRRAPHSGAPSAPSANNDKRRSWLKKRFSKT